MFQSKRISLVFLDAYRDHCLFLLRVSIGSFLVWGVWDNIISSENMLEFEKFLTNFGFVQPRIMAFLSVWAQFLIGCSFVVGLFVRWAGLLCAFNFVVAIVMVDSLSGIRASFPSLCLVVVGLYLATSGAGRFGLDMFLHNK